MGYHSKMTKKPFLFLLFLFPLITFHAAFAQDTEFEKWKKQQEAEFREYQDKFDEEFIKMLEETWKEVGIKDGSDLYKERKPVTIPKAPPKPVVENKAPKDLPPLKERISADLPKLPERETTRATLPDRISLFDDIPVQNTSIDYFSSAIPFQYPSELRKLFSRREFSAGRTDNKRIAAFWDKVSRVDHEPILEYGGELREDLKLNDWGYVLLMNDFAETVFAGYDRKLVNLYTWFLLSRSGFQVRIGYDQRSIYLLYAVEYNVFNTKYYTLDGDQYYVIDLDADKQSPSSIFTYSGSHQQQRKKLDLKIEEYPVLGNEETSRTKTLEFSYDGKEYSFPVSIDMALVDYFEFYPLTELPVFFTASLSPASKQSIYPKLVPILSDMTEEEAVNFLLGFVQTAFEYETDQDQFDREKYMLPEETLFYPSSDCDDRAILFANLVQDLVGLEVVGLRYSKHLATAVAFTDKVSGDQHFYQGKTYTVTDPTYVNASIGMTMPQYQNETPEILSLK